MITIAKSDGTVYIDTRMDTGGFGTGVTNLKSQCGKLSGAFGKLGGIIAGAFSVSAIIQFAKSAIDLGSDLQEVQNVVEVTFGSMSSTIDDFAKNAITQFGLSELAAKQYASTMGAMLKSMGFTVSQAADMSMELAGLAGDIASFYNLDAGEAFAKIRSGISGETEPLKQLGINLSVANLEAYALSQGITKSYDAMSQQEQALLRYNYLLKTTADAQGDFSRTSASWANQTRILSEQFNSLKATIGQGLINALTPALTVINAILTGLQKIATAFKQLTVALFGDAGGGSAIDDAAGSLDSATESVDGYTDAVNAAAKANKKALAGFDEITRLNNSKTGNNNENPASSGSVNLGISAEIGGDLSEDGILPQIQALADKIKETLEPLRQINFDPVKQSLSGLGDSFFNLLSRVKPISDLLWEDVLAPLAEWTIEEAVPQALDTLAAGFDVVATAADPVAKGLQSVWDALSPFVSFIEETVLHALEKLKEHFNRLRDVFAEKSPEIEKIFENLSEIIGKLWEVAEPVLTWLREKWEWAFDLISQATSTKTEGIIDDLYALTEIIAGAFSGDWDRVWTAISDNAISKWETVKETFSGVAKWFVNNVISPLSCCFSDLWADLTSGIKEGINGAIGKINDALDNIFGGINKMIQKLGDIKIAGATLFPNIATISAPHIPYLAQGAVIPPNAPFMAVLGDQRSGNNIEAPEGLIRKIMQDELAGISDDLMAVSEATVALLRDILEAVIGIHLTDDDVGQAVARYNARMKVTRGGI